MDEIITDSQARRDNQQRVIQFRVDAERYMRTYGIHGYEPLENFGAAQIAYQARSHPLEIQLAGFATPEQEPVSLTALSAQLIRLKQNGVRLLHVSLNSTEPNIYDAFKQVADIQTGFHTVCRSMEKTSIEARHKPRFLGNLMMKINLKLGGTNSQLDRKPSIITEQTMFVGLDVMHPPGRAMEGAPSIAAAVATCDTNMGQWPPSFRQQQPQEDEKKSVEMIAEPK